MKADGGPAFAQVMVQHPNGTMVCGWDGYGMGGMSLRDYFAATALQGLLASMAHPQASGSNLDCYPQSVEQAYAIADAMLAERVKP